MGLMPQRGRIAGILRAGLDLGRPGPCDRPSKPSAQFFKLAMQTLSFNLTSPFGRGFLSGPRHPPTPLHRTAMLLGMPLRSFAVSPLGAACIALFLQGAPAMGAGHAAPPMVALSPADDRLLDEIERAGFRFFVEQSHPRTGLVRDRARADGSGSEGKASIAASGFCLAAWPIAVERGWVSRAEALERVRSMLDFLATQAPRQHGFFYHFMEMDTGAPAWNCEVSSIDSALPSPR